MEKTDGVIEGFPCFNVGVLYRFTSKAKVLGIVALFWALTPQYVEAARNVEAARSVVIVAIGDSLTAGYGLGVKEGFTAQLQRALEERGHDDVSVRNAGVSGDTAAEGASRLLWSLEPRADAVILSLGANDMLRSLPPSSTREHLSGMLEELALRGIPVLLSGFRASLNSGREYREEFDSMYLLLANERDNVELYPHFLEGVALRPRLNQRDGIHPNAEGVLKIVENITPYVERLVRRAREASQ